MFGTLGVSELIIIVVIVLIIFGAGRLPQIGEGIGKALKGFKKEVHEAPPALDPNAPQAQAEAGQPQQAPIEEAQVVPGKTGQATVGQPPPPPASKPTAPYQPGPELTPGTTAALMASAAPQKYEPPKPKVAQPARPAQQGQAAAPGAPTPAPPPVAQSMEDRQAHVPPPRAAYPPLPATAPGKAPVKRPSAIVNKDAVARVQAQQAALKAKAAQNAQGGGLSPKDMQGLGEGLGDALRTFRQAVSDVRGAVDPEMRTIQAEMDAAQKELEQSIEAAKEMPAVQEDPPKPA